MEVTTEDKIKLGGGLREGQRESEARVGGLLRAHRLDGLHFRRRRPIGRFVADFCCEGAKLVVEIDGGYHDAPEQKELDSEREAHFTGRGYTVLRFSVDEVMNDSRSVLRRISESARAKREAEGDRPPSPAAGEG